MRAASCVQVSPVTVMHLLCIGVARLHGVDASLIVTLDHGVRVITEVCIRQPNTKASAMPASSMPR